MTLTGMENDTYCQLVSILKQFFDQTALKKQYDKAKLYEGIWDLEYDPQVLWL